MECTKQTERWNGWPFPGLVVFDELLPNVFDDCYDVPVSKFCVPSHAERETDRYYWQDLTHTGVMFKDIPSEMFHIFESANLLVKQSISIQGCGQPFKHKINVTIRNVPRSKGVTKNSKKPFKRQKLNRVTYSMDLDDFLRLCETDVLALQEETQMTFGNITLRKYKEHVQIHVGVARANTSYRNVPIHEIEKIQHCEQSVKNIYKYMCSVDSDRQHIYVCGHHNTTRQEILYMIYASALTILDQNEQDKMHMFRFEMDFDEQKNLIKNDRYWLQLIYCIDIHDLYKCMCTIIRDCRADTLCDSKYIEKSKMKIEACASACLAGTSLLENNSVLHKIMQYMSLATKPAVNCYIRSKCTKEYGFRIR